MNTLLQLDHFGPQPTAVAIERWPSSIDGIVYTVEVPRSDYHHGSLERMLQLSLVAVHALALRFQWRRCDAFLYVSNLGAHYINVDCDLSYIHSVFLVHQRCGIQL